MSRATRRWIRRLAVVFDYDDTLAPDSMDGFLQAQGADVERFWKERVQPRVDADWDPIPAAFWSLIELSREQQEIRPVTREALVEHGRGEQPFEGVPELFGRLRSLAREVDSDIEVEFFVVSSGLGEVIRNAPIAEHLTAVFASELHFGDDGAVAFVKRIVTHTEKTRFLYAIARGAWKGGNPRLVDVHRDIPEDEVHIPLDQMIYVGDGLTDVPSFSLLAASNGIGLGVYKEGTAQKWGEGFELSRGERVANLARADFSEGSELSRSLELAVERIAREIALRELSEGE